jgi:hypothetical protein
MDCVFSRPIQTVAVVGCLDMEDLSIYMTTVFDEIYDE